MHTRKEPSQLRRGKRFHREVQAEWEATAEGDVVREKLMTKRSGRRGRMDIHVDSGATMDAIVEIKATNWDRMTLPGVRRNVRRQVRQIWDYIEANLDLGKDVSPGVIFPKRPKSLRRLKLIEEMFLEEGIVAVWQDE